jgi:predicted kinase
MSKAKVYLLSGRTGAGKTTVAKRLEKELPALRLSHDELLQILYGDSLSKENHQEKCHKVNIMVWSLVKSLAPTGTNILVEGWGTRPLRDQARRELDSMGVNYNFIFVDCLQDIRRERIKAQNSNLGEFDTYISDEDFERMEQLREEFDEDEEFTSINTGDV